jgi:tRNA(fMet)-specific endonuclease VapC
MLLVDTNIIIHLIRNDQTGEAIDRKFNLSSQLSQVAISIVTVGELYSFALQREWGKNKIVTLEKMLSLMLIIEINSPEIISKYAEIDSYSQNRLKDKPMPTSARKMGKNDVWIAASAAVLNVPLLTTDADFSHLNEVYLELHRL